MFKITGKYESGRSMLEIIGALAVMTMMSVGAFVLIRNANAAQKRNTVVEDFAGIAAAVRALYADYDDLNDLDGDGAMAAMGIDKNKTPYPDTSYSVEQVGINGKDKKTSLDETKASDDQYDFGQEDIISSFKVTISGSGLPAKDCTVLLHQAWPDSISGKADGECGEKINSRSISVIYKK